MLLRYIGSRLVSAAIGVIGVTFLTFVLVHATARGFLPGLSLNPNIKAADIARIKRELGLTRPFYAQYWSWITDLFHGDLGRSLVTGQSVTGLILSRLANTALLAGTAMVLALVLAVPLGVGAARRAGRFWDHVFTTGAVLGVSVPTFWLGLMCVLLFSVEFSIWGLPALPSAGAVSAVGGGDLVDRVRHLILPAFVLGVGLVSVWMPFVRSSVVENLGQDYVRTARAKGLPERRVIYRHVLSNSLLSLVTLLGLEIPTIFGGAAVVEIVFSWPGVGRLALDSALQFDYTTVLGVTTFVAVAVVIGNLLADCAYAMLDPRIRLGGDAG